MFNHPQYQNFIHFSFVVQGNKIIGYGRNNCETPAKHMGYHNRVPTPKMHSEINAYRKTRGILDRAKPFYLVNVRLNKSGEVRLSKPCVCCYSLLNSLGCKQIYYSSEVGFLGT